jgi:hypothetical protein
MTAIKLEHCRVCRARFTGKEEMSQLGLHILREHPVDAWKAYAEIYLDRMWFGQNEQDKRFVKEFESTITVEKLDNMFGKYNLSRNFVNGVCGYGPARLQRFADMLNGYRDKEITKKEFPDIVENELENMREAYGFEPLSAITKSFWMMHQHPVVIRDTLALEGLNRRGLGPGSTYRTYFAAWFKFLDDPGTQKGLDEAIKWLPESPAAHGIMEAARADGAKQGESAAEEKVQAVGLEIRELAAKQLMRNRIVDMRLLYEGGGFLEDSRTACSASGNNKLAVA